MTLDTPLEMERVEARPDLSVARMGPLTFCSNGCLFVEELGDLVIPPGNVISEQVGGWSLTRTAGCSELTLGAPDGAVRRYSYRDGRWYSAGVAPSVATQPFPLQDTEVARASLPPLPIRDLVMGRIVTLTDWAATAAKNFARIVDLAVKFATTLLRLGVMTVFVLMILMIVCAAFGIPFFL